jgi:hypothetical protein
MVLLRAVKSLAKSRLSKRFFFTEIKVYFSEWKNVVSEQ